MGVDVSKAAVDARVAERTLARNMQLGLLVAAAVLIGIRLYEGAWLPLGWSIGFAIIVLGFAAGRSDRPKKS